MNKSFLGYHNFMLYQIAFISAKGISFGLEKEISVFNFFRLKIWFISVLRLRSGPNGPALISDCYYKWFQNMVGSVYLVLSFGCGIGFLDFWVIILNDSEQLDNGNQNELILNVWIIEIKINWFSPASTLASDIRYINKLEV
ncbi:hypothetical protein C1646_663357 [Rhizophagus diaphanus]|nr:hypothetical protein C1646_663357 [Rhizophagus diaphanus] [Rhizophagus sp. MUCL 43196]